MYSKTDIIHTEHRFSRKFESHDSNFQRIPLLGNRHRPSLDCRSHLRFSHCGPHLPSPVARLALVELISLFSFLRSLIAICVPRRALHSPRHAVSQHRCCRVTTMPIKRNRASMPSAMHLASTARHFASKVQRGIGFQPVDLTMPARKPIPH